MIIAIDPGKAGAIAMQDYKQTSFTKMPENRYDLIDFFRDVYRDFEGDCVAIVEQLHAGSGHRSGEKIPRGAKQIWSQAANYESIMCALYAAGIKTIEVSPQKWMSKVNGTRPKKYEERKAWLHEQAKMLYPTLKAPKYAADALCLLHVSENFI